MNTSEEWLKSLEGLEFAEYAQAVRDKILEGNMDEQSKKQFSDCFEYAMELYNEGKQFDIKLFKIYLEDIKGYKNVNMSGVINILLLLSFCGFSFKNT